MDKFEGVCHNAVEALSHRAALMDDEHLSEVVARLRDERNTWRLIRLLYRARVEAEHGTGGSALSAATLSHPFSSPAELVAAVLDTDPKTMELRLMLSWLEAMAAESVETSSEDASWARTTEPFFVDLDAPLREERRLHPVDEEHERLLLSGVWSLVRAGRQGDAAKLCRQCGQPWRAAALTGSTLFHDAEPGAGATGNTFREVWVKAARHLSESARDPHERAVFAVLSGQTAGALPVCKTWEDRLWVELSARLFEITRRAASRADLPREALPLSAGPGFFREVQLAVMEGSELALVDRMATATPGTPHARFAAALCLFWRSLGMDLPSPAWETVVRGHISELSQARLVALYTSRLPATLHTETFSMFLLGVHDTVERKESLVHATQAGLDARAIASATSRKMSPADRILALEWLWFDPKQHAEALERSNELLTELLLEARIDEAEELLAQEPRDAVESVKRGWPGGGIEPPEAEFRQVQLHLDLAALVAASRPEADPAQVTRALLTSSLPDDLRRATVPRLVHNLLARRNKDINTMLITLLAHEPHGLHRWCSDLKQVLKMFALNN